MEKTPTPNFEDLVMPPNPMAKLSEMPSFEEHMRQFDDNGSSSEMSQEENKRFATTEAEAAANAARAAHEEIERQRQAEQEEQEQEQEEMPEIQDSHYNEEAEEFFAKLGLDVARPQSQPSKKKHNHEHIPSRHPEFLKNQAIAIKEGQRMVGNEKRPYYFPHEVSEMVKNGEDIHELIKNVDAMSVWAYMDEFVKNGATIEEVFDNMPKRWRCFSIDELVRNGYNVDKLADKLDDEELFMEADTLVKNGANVDRLKQRLPGIKYVLEILERKKAQEAANQAAAKNIEEASANANASASERAGLDY